MPKLSRRKRKQSRRAKTLSSARAHLDKVMAQVERLLDAGNIADALDLLEANRNRLGQFAPLNAALATLYGEVGRYWDAAVHARLALDLEPKNPDYYLLAALSYLGAEFYTLAHRACREWLRSATSGPMLQEMREFDEEQRRRLEEIRVEYGVRDYKTTERAGYLMDQGRWAMSQNRWTDALRHSQAATKLAPRWPPPRNNISVSLFYLNRYADAISEAKTVLTGCDPDNVHALANLVRFCVAAGDLAEASRYAERLAALPPSDDLLDVIKRIEALRFLDQDVEIERIAREAHERFGDLLPANVLISWAIAVANLGRPAEALDRLRRVRSSREISPEISPLLESTVEALEAGKHGPGIADRFPHTHFSELLPREAIEQAMVLLTRDGERGRRDDGAWAKLLRQYPVLPMVVTRMFFEIPGAVAPMAELLVAIRTPEIRATLLEFVRGQQGEESDRMAVLRTVQQAGLISDGEQMEMWIDGRQQSISSYMLEISDEFVPDYPMAAWNLYEKALIAQREDRWGDAEHLYEEMLKVAPNAKEAYNNLARIYLQRGETERADDYLDKALEIDPLYPFPVTTRALQALGRGDTAAANEWMEPLLAVRKWHPLGFIVYQKVLARIAMIEKEYEAAHKHLELAQQLNEDDPEIADLLQHLTLLEGMSGWADMWREHADKYRQRRQKAKLPADPTLEDCFGLLTKGDMTGIRRVLGITGVSTYKKAKLKQYLMDTISDVDELAYIVEHQLYDENRVALDDLLAHGGVMDWQAFADVHGDDLEESPYLEYHAEDLETAMGRLRAHGLLFEGTANGRLIVAIPREIRPLLQEILASN